MIIQAKKLKLRWRNNMKNIKKIFLLILFFCTTSLFADNVSVSGAQFLNLPIGAKAIGMGEAVVATCNDASSLYWNPAGIAFAENKNILFMHGIWFSDVSYDWLGYVQPTIFGGVGVTVQYINYGTLSKTDESGNNQGTFNPNDKLVSFSYARFFDTFTAGVTGKYIESVITKSANAYAADFGVQYQVNDFINLGLVARNYIASEIKYNKKADELTKSLDLGISYSDLTNMLFEVDVRKMDDSDLKFGFGTEYTLMPEIAVRAGYNTLATEVEGLTGLSLGFGFQFGKYKMDYAYKPLGELGDTHLVSFGVEI
jgi:hypothetical protein